MGPVYRIVWKSNKTGGWRYASGEDLRPLEKLFPGSEQGLFEPGKPYLFIGSTGWTTADRVARAMSDLPGVEKVLLREEDTLLEFVGTKKEEA